jgi:pyruvate-formate lyase-activating enzyme
MLPSNMISAIQFSQAILDGIDPAAQSLPERPTVAFVWPTNLCSIGCAHCSFASRRTGDPSKQLLANHPDHLTEWLAAAGTRKVIICGGGEPLDEPEFITRTISACAMLGLECAIYTSGVSRRADRDSGEHSAVARGLGASCPAGAPAGPPIQRRPIPRGTNRS